MIMRREEVALQEWPKDLIHLRYLGFRYCNNLGNIALLFFNNLETIDLKGSHGYRYCSDVEEVPRLGCSTKKLRTLGIYYGRKTDRDEEWETLKGVLTRTTELVSLSIKMGIDVFRNRSYYVLLPFGNGGTRGLPCHETIQSLLLHGRWTNLEHSRITLVPSVEMFPTNLTKLTLHISGLEEDPMPIFEKLQNLRILRLRGGSYVGTKLICSTGGFLKLEKLELRQLRHLTGHK
ncbi:putative disease resistance protein RF45 [Carex rostrata]